MWPGIELGSQRWKVGYVTASYIYYLARRKHTGTFLNSWLYWRFLWYLTALFRLPRTYHRTSCSSDKTLGLSSLSARFESRQGHRLSCWVPPTKCSTSTCRLRSLLSKFIRMHHSSIAVPLDAMQLYMDTQRAADVCILFVTWGGDLEWSLREALRRTRLEHLTSVSRNSPGNARKDVNVIGSTDMIRTRSLANTLSRSVYDYRRYFDWSIDLLTTYKS
jgi:hypothetical protein